MRPDILILGQGLAGTVLGWALEEAGLGFAMADPGLDGAASVAAAGMLNPVTGRRIVKSWRADRLMPAARASYRRIEAALGEACWRELRIRRLFATDREREVLAAKSTTGELAPFVDSADRDGFWIEGAAQVDLGRFLTASRARWRTAGRLLPEAVSPTAVSHRYGLVIDCRGVAATPAGGEFGFVPWAYSKGELIEIEVEGLAANVVIHRRHWVLPIASGRALVGATHEPGVTNTAVTTVARDQLQASAERLAGRAITVRQQRAGVRVTLPDKRPVIGRHPDLPWLGLVNGLGAKGAMLAPYLAAQWVAHLQHGASFDPEIDVRRFGGPSGRRSPAALAGMARECS